MGAESRTAVARMNYDQNVDAIVAAIGAAIALA